MHKTCRLCNKIKSIDEFHLKKGTPDGHRNECKECVKDIQKKYKEAPGFKEKQKEYDKKRYDEKREEILQRKKEYHVENRERILSYKKEYRSIPENRERTIEYLNKYREDNKERNKEWRENNRQSLAINQHNYRINNPHIVAWRTVLYSTLKRLGTSKEAHTVDMLGYSAIELKDYISSKFLDGMTWENHGEWHIDHIRAVSTFSDTTSIKEVCALENLQPLWALDNLSKNKY